MRVLAAVVVLVAGCVAEEPATPPVECEADSCDEWLDRPPANATASFDAPDLPLGRAWTYDLFSFYDVETEVTIVVASKDEGGYLFAGAAEDDLLGEALWGRSWFGPHTRALARDAPWGPKPFDFPLEDGKTWTYREGVEVTARAADVRTPAGTEPGFVVEGSGTTPGGTEVAVHLTYAPSVGNFVDMVYGVAGAPFYELHLKDVGSSATYTWYELGPRLDAYMSSPPTEAVKTLDVPAGLDAVLLSAGGAGGGRGAVVPPGGADAWNGESAGGETWTARAYPATPGTWTASATAPPDGWYYVGLQAVTWLAGDVGAAPAASP